MAAASSKPFASSADLAAKEQTLEVLADGVYALTAEGDPNVGAIIGYLVLIWLTASRIGRRGSYFVFALGALLFIQGIAQVFRCILCIRQGYWPPRAQDVEEMEKLLVDKRTRSSLLHGSEAVDIEIPDPLPPEYNSDGDRDGRQS